MAPRAGVMLPSPRRRHAHGAAYRSASGTTLLEILVVLAIALVVAASGLTGLAAVRRERAGREAARLLMHELQAVAYDARLSGTSHAVRLFQTDAGEALLQVFVDGNGNGVRAGEIDSGVDAPSGPPRRAFTEGAARLAIVRDVPTTDHAGVLAAGADPVRFGVAPHITFTPRRTGASGSIYIAGPGDHQYAIRVLGTTGRLRLLCIDAGQGRWEGC